MMAALRLLFVIVATAIVSTIAVANDFSIEENDLVSVPAAAVAAIQAEVSSSDYKNCRLVGKAVDLAGSGKRADWVVTTADGCSWGAATGPILVLRNKAGAYSLVLTSGGAGLTIGKIKKNGLRHLTIVAGTAGWYSEVLFKYDGSKYAKTRSRQVNLTDPEDCRKNRDVCAE